MPGNPRIAVVSPFLDRRHGTERCTLEQIERLARDYGYEIHLYSQRVADLQNAELWVPHAAPPMPGRIYWHKISSIPGPHLFQFLWWMIANRFCRWRDSRSGRLRFDLVYSPGINCLDADAVTVHAVFHGLLSRTQERFSGAQKPAGSWPTRLHRRLYYRVLRNLENRIYANPDLAIAAVSPRTAAQLERHFRRKDVRVIPNGVDLDAFNPKARLSRRPDARKRFAFRDHEFVALLIGNDWRNKGLVALLEASASCPDLPLKLLVVGQDDPTLIGEVLERFSMTSRVCFQTPSADVLQFYAAVDVYASPSLEDSFALPVAEAMACALPVVTSAEAGISAFLQDGVDSFVLRDPSDSAALAAVLRRLYEDSALRRTLGENAVRTAQALNWEKNAALTKQFLEEAMRAKKSRKVNTTH
ncbi:MAG TPA: glycosyltransferase family 4 protein [Candidatus Acidoferrales bacterium]|nr:glycosyltransferase family 4 protein [Candidatus Acidoferrales bacterium]